MSSVSTGQGAPVASQPLSYKGGHLINKHFVIIPVLVFSLRNRKCDYKLGIRAHIVETQSFCLVMDFCICSHTFFFFLLGEEINITLYL